MRGERHAPALSILGESNPGSHWIEGMVDPRSALDAGAWRIVLAFAGNRTPVVQSAVRHYSDRVTPAILNTCYFAF
jgi:hypothetical protein